MSNLWTPLPSHARVRAFLPISALVALGSLLLWPKLIWPTAPIIGQRVQAMEHPGAQFHVPALSSPPARALTVAGCMLSNTSLRIDHPLQVVSAGVMPGVTQGADKRPLYRLQIVSGTVTPACVTGLLVSDAWMRAVVRAQF